MKCIVRPMLFVSMSTSVFALRGPARSFLRRTSGRSTHYRHHHLSTTAAAATPAAATAATGAGTPSPSPSPTSPPASHDPHSTPPAFSFGLIADIQYVDADDATNFSGTTQRFYRHSFSTYQEAVRYWGTLQPAPACALVLGDILDGKTAQMKNQEECIGRILEASRAAPCPVYYCYGNHEHYAFGRPDIHDKLSPHWLERYVAEGSPSAPVGGVCNAAKLYYDWSPAPRWRFVSLDCYDVSLIGASSEPHRELAASLLAENNPNDLNAGGTWFNNLPFHKRRWVPYNGGVGADQVRWFHDVLAKSREMDEKVVVFCHQPVYAPDKPQSVVWNAEELLDAVHASGNVVVWLAGHDHSGQYSRDKKGVHHLVPPAPLECRPPHEVAYGHVEVFSDRLRLKWRGKTPRAPLLPWPEDLMFPDAAAAPM